ncbi:hypothetical protein BJV78DRAFT_1182932, partial [Lactifluus subvellereus]
MVMVGIQGAPSFLFLLPCFNRGGSGVTFYHNAGGGGGFGGYMRTMRGASLSVCLRGRSFIGSLVGYLGGIMV